MELMPVGSNPVSSKTAKQPRATARRSLLQRAREQQGNTLVLFPVAVLILFGLGAIALDSATMFLAQRRLSDLAASVSHDSIAGLDRDAFYDGEVRVDQGRASSREVQLRPETHQQDRAFENVSCAVTTGVTSGMPSATADCTATVRPILASFWGLNPTRTIDATETSVGVEG